MTAESCYVVLHIGLNPQDAGAPSILPGSNQRFILTNDIWIEKLDQHFAKNVQRACEPAHYKIDSIVNDRHLYAFVRKWMGPETFKYEGMEALFTVIALSRLVHPTSIGNRYCAWVQRSGEDSAIHAIEYRGISPDVFLSEGNRDWLSVDDGNELLKLVPWFSNKPMHPRVHRAYWNFDYATHSYYLDMRWTLVVSGLDGLINVEPNRNRQQFCLRTRKLADELSVNLTDGEISDAWKLRSKLAHAKGFLFNFETILPNADHKPLYDKLELLLRLTIKRCLLDSAFHDRFRDDISVQNHWGKIS